MYINWLAKILPFTCILSSRHMFSGVEKMIRVSYKFRVEIGEDKLYELVI